MLFSQVTQSYLNLSCIAAPGVGFGYSITVTIAYVASVASVAYLSYLPPTLMDAVGNGAVGADTAGGDPMTLIGSNLGPVGTSPVVQYGRNGIRYVATGCTVTVASVQIQCTAAAGTGAG